LATEGGVIGMRRRTYLLKESCKLSWRMFPSSMGFNQFSQGKCVSNKREKREPKGESVRVE
jgi:hypothetical protein